MLKKKKAQSLLEYGIIFTAIVGAILVAASKKIAPAVDHTFGQVQTSIEKSADTFADNLGK